jgi:hypothetical protein
VTNNNILKTQAEIYLQVTPRYKSRTEFTSSFRTQGLQFFNRKLQDTTFSNNVIDWIFGPKRDEVTGEWRRLHKRKLYALYSSPDIIRVIKARRLRWAGHVARMGERRGIYRALVGKPEGRRALGRPRRRWEDNIKIDLREVGWGA